MPIRTTCPSCRTVYTLADQYAGKTVRCKECQAAIVVRAAKERAGDDEDDAGSRGKIQSRPRASSPAERGSPTRARPRRREREDDWDSERSIQHSNRGLVIGLIAGGAVLTLLLVGGIVAIVLLLGRSADNPSDLPAGADAGGRPGRNPPKFLAEADEDPAWPSLGMRILPPDSAILHIAGVVDDNTHEAISERLDSLFHVDGHHIVKRARQGDRMSVLVVFVGNVQAFSRKLDFGTVDSIKDRIITVTARKVDGPPPNADAVAKAIHRLKSPDANKRREAARRLKDSLPDQRRAEVVKALAPLLNDSDVFTRQFAIEALGVWGDKDTVPLLISAMQGRETRHEAMNALARIKDERAAEAIAARLEEFGDLLLAAQALKKMGPIAEKAVLARLNHGEFQVRIMVCEILTVIGTKQSIAPLEKVVDAGKDPFAGQDHLVAMRAKETLKAIQRRQN